jgi:amino-acid N-acetyltransferase
VTRSTKRTTQASPACGDGGLEVRKASMRDIPGLLRLINGFAAEGIMLPRTEFEIAENIRDFSVIHEGEHLAGCAALHF